MPVVRAMPTNPAILIEASGGLARRQPRGHPLRGATGSAGADRKWRSHQFAIEQADV